VSKPPKSRRPRRTPPTIDLKAASSTVTPLDPPPDSDSPSAAKASGGASRASARPASETAGSAPVETPVGSSDVMRSAEPEEARAEGASAAGTNGGAASRRSRVYGSAGTGEDGVTGGAVATELGPSAGDTSAPAFPDSPPSREPDEPSMAARVPNISPVTAREESGSRADAPARRSLGFGSLLGAGVLGGLVGAGATFLAAPFLNPAPRPDPRIAVMEERLGAVPPRDQIGSLERRLSTLEGEQTGVNERLRAAQGAAERGLARAEEAFNRPAGRTAGDGQPATGVAPVVPGTALAELTTRLEALEGRARQQDATPAAPSGASPAEAPSAGVPAVPDERLQALARQVDALENAVRERGQAQDAAASVEPRLAEQDRRLGEIDGRLGGIETTARERAQELSGALQGLQSAVGRLEQSAQSLQGIILPLPDAVRNLDRRLGEQDGRLAGLSRQIEAADGRLNALGQQLQAQDGRLGALGQQLQGQDGRLAEIGQRLQAQDGRLTDIGQQVRGQDERLAALQGGIQGQDARLSDLARQFADRDPAPTLRVVAADRVAGALREGAPYAPALDALRRLGADPAPLQALEPFAAGGAPTAAALAGEFRPLGERMIREGRPAPASLTDRLWRMADEVVTVRPVGEGTGTDVESGVARIEAALRRGAIAEAAATFDALPEVARAPAEAFGRKLRERAAAEAAADQISAAALSALSTPR
jgi:hypothetical protein